jgi:hypothetical protein
VESKVKLNSGVFNELGSDSVRSDLDLSLSTGFGLNAAGHRAGFGLNAAGLRSGNDITVPEFELHLPLKTIIVQKCPLSPRNQPFSFPMLNQAG